MAAYHSLIAPTSNPELELQLRTRLRDRGEVTGMLGELEPLAVRIGLMQNTLRPELEDPQLLLFVADHGIAVDGLASPDARVPTTSELVTQLLTQQQPVGVFAQLQGMVMTVVDAGVAETLPERLGFVVRKIAHGTRNSRANLAMTVEQAHAAIRAGMEIADTLPGNVMACAGVGTGSHESAALVLSRLTHSSIRSLLQSGRQMDPQRLAHLLTIAQGAQTRHSTVTDAVEVLAAFGGYETAMMVGAMLVSASRRHLVMVDGIAACAALMVASRIAPSVLDYCVFSRSRGHHGLSHALDLFRSTALLELGMECLDGTGAPLAWPLVRSAAALLTEVVDQDDLRSANSEETVTSAGVPQAATEPSPLAN